MSVSEWEWGGGRGGGGGDAMRADCEGSLVSALVGGGGIVGGDGGGAGVGLEIEAAGVTDGIFTATGGSNSFLGLGFFG